MGKEVGLWLVLGTTVVYRLQLLERGIWEWAEENTS